VNLQSAGSWPIFAVVCLHICFAQRYEKVGQSESESEWSKDEKKEGYSQDEGETDIEESQVLNLCFSGPHV
jgi:hypothetical protein